MARKRRFDAVGRGAATRGSAGAPRSPHSPGRPIPVKRRGAGSAQADRIRPRQRIHPPHRSGQQSPPVPAGDNPATAKMLGLDRVEAGLIPLEHCAQAAVAGRAARGRQGSKQRVAEVAVAADVAQRACSGVGQWLTGLLLLRLPAGLKPGQA
jgi:hypothetical protein